MITRPRSSSSSSPSASICSVGQVWSRWVVHRFQFSLGFVELKRDVPGGDRDAELDVLVLLVGDLAGADVAHGAGRLAAGAGVADAHPAAELGREAGGLGLLEQRAAADRGGAVAAQEAQRARRPRRRCTVSVGGVNVSASKLPLGRRRARSTPRGRRRSATAARTPRPRCRRRPRRARRRVRWPPVRPRVAR